MNINAAILWEQGTPLSVESAELLPPREGEVLVEVKSAGVCHSDLHPIRGDWPTRTPLVPGHEGAGIVREVGSEVRNLQVGDHVVFCWAPPCGKCEMCLAGRPVLCDRLPKTSYRNQLPAGGSRLRARDQEVNHFNATACFADFAVVAEEGAVKVDKEVSFDVLSTLGCAVVTGVGAVTNAARVQRGANVVVIGAGGVGLNVIQGAVLNGCEHIIATDLRDSALTLAKEFGATDVINAAEKVPDAVRGLTANRAADVVFDTVGTAQTIAQALECTRKGGAVVVTGLSRQDTIASVPVFLFVMQEKRLIGSLYGSGSPAADISKLVSLYQSGKLKLRELVTHRYRLNQVNEALDSLASGTDARGIIEW